MLLSKTTPGATNPSQSAAYTSFPRYIHSCPASIRYNYAHKVAVRRSLTREERLFAVSPRLSSRAILRAPRTRAKLDRGQDGRSERRSAHRRRKTSSGSKTGRQGNGSSRKASPDPGPGPSEQDASGPTNKPRPSPPPLNVDDQADYAAWTTRDIFEVVVQELRSRWATATQGKWRPGASKNAYLATKLRDAEEEGYMAAGVLPYITQLPSGETGLWFLMAKRAPTRDKTSGRYKQRYANRFVILGGKREKKDKSSVHTAAREAWEETEGLLPRGKLERTLGSDWLSPVCWTPGGYFALFLYPMTGTAKAEAIEEQFARACQRAPDPSREVCSLEWVPYTKVIAKAQRELVHPFFRGAIRQPPLRLLFDALLEQALASSPLRSPGAAASWELVNLHKQAEAGAEAPPAPAPAAPAGARGSRPDPPSESQWESVQVGRAPGSSGDGPASSAAPGGSTAAALPDESDGAPSTSTPAPSSSTPATSTSTPAPRSSTPATSTSTPAPRSSTPVPRSSTPATSTSTPAPRSSTPVPRSSTPATSTSTPAPRSSTPVPRSSTPATSTSIPATSSALGSSTPAPAPSSPASSPTALTSNTNGSLPRKDTRNGAKSRRCSSRDPEGAPRLGRPQTMDRSSPMGGTSNNIVGNDAAVASSSSENGCRSQQRAASNDAAGVDVRSEVQCGASSSARRAPSGSDAVRTGAKARGAARGEQAPNEGGVDAKMRKVQAALDILKQLKDESYD